MYVELNCISEPNKQSKKSKKHNDTLRPFWLVQFLYSCLMERSDSTTYLGNSASHNCDDVVVYFVIGSVPQEVLVALFDSSDRHYENERGESGPRTYWTVWQYCLKHQHCSLICEIKPSAD